MSNTTLTDLVDADLLSPKGLFEERWQAPASAACIEVINPFDQQVIGSVPSLSKQDVKDAIALSVKAQQQWASLTAQKRARHLNQWADLIDAHKSDLALIMTTEQGKPLQEARGEIGYANAFIRWFAEEAKRVYGDVILPTQTHIRQTVLKQPVGVCAAITPWNFPSAMITRKAAPALAAGCTMIIKPAMQTPFSALALVALAGKAGIPEGVLQVVTGEADVVGEVLTSDARIKKLSFTGSTEVGRKLMAQCAPTVKKLSLELGGNAPFIVFEDADLKKAVAGLIASKYRNAGQTCISANRIYVHASIKETFLQALSDEVAKLKVGSGLEDVHIGPLINQQAVDKVQALLKDALDKGATLVTGGQAHSSSSFAIKPTIITDLTEQMDLVHTEVFGPVAPILTFTSESEVIAAANDTIYGLAAYFYTKDHARAWRVAEALDFGMVGHNTGSISNEVAPFGGIKQSGFGREGSKYGIDEYVTTKYWCSDIQ